MLERLKKSLLEAPVFKRGEYDYFIHPITDGVPEIRPDLIREVTANIVRIANLDVDKIVTVEAMGIPIGIVLSILCDIPLVIIRKRKYGLPNEVEISQVTGYSRSQLYLNGINRGDRVIVVDDVISTGGALLALEAIAHRSNGTIVGKAAVLAEGDAADRKDIIYLEKLPLFFKQA